MKRSNKGAALIFAIFLVLGIFSFISIVCFQYIADAMIQRHYENSLCALYTLEAAKTACLWEEAHSPLYINNWDTRKNPPCHLGGASIDPQSRLYSLTINGRPYNFRAKTRIIAGQIFIYARAFEGTAAAPVDSRYLEYIYSPSPMYQYIIFSNRSLNFWADNLYDCAGGKIHTNGDIGFSTSGGSWPGLRFRQIGQFSAAGAIKYNQRSSYLAPHFLDALDGNPSDGMAPAPALTGPHYQTTSGATVTPGPDRHWVNDGGAWSLQMNDFGGSSLGGWWAQEWDSGKAYEDNGHPITYNNIPLDWLGEESFFCGKQYNGSRVVSMAGEAAADGHCDISYLKRDGTIGSEQDYKDNPANYATTTVFAQPYLDIGSTSSSPSGFYYTPDVVFSPAKDKEGNPQDRFWTQIPGSLPEEYTWENKDKYYSRGKDEPAVTFYATESCAEGSSGCIVDKGPNSTNNTGWRYIKNDADGNSCVNDGCYQSSQSNYVKAQDYTVDGKKYFDNLSLDPGDNNQEFFSDKTYGNNDADYKIHAFNSEKQKEGFQQYLAQLSLQGLPEDVLEPGVERKEPFLGEIFDDPGGGQDSAYKIKAKDNGIYIPADKDAEAIVSQLNQGLAPEQAFAKPVTFYNWKTGLPVSLVDIDLGKMKAAGKSPANGIIYAEYPIRLSNATNLPGDNSGDKQAVFTVISEESVYLKGSYNTDDWKISHIATKKKVYTLSDKFNDPQSPPDSAIYPEYPHIYVKVTKDAGGTITNYEYDSDLNAEVDAKLPPEQRHGIWINADEVKAKYSDGSPVYFYGMTDETRNDIVAAKAAKQADYEKYGGKDGGKINPPNNVCADGDSNCSYTYNSLFICPYDSNQGDDSLENWNSYTNADGHSVQPTKNMKGAFLDFYDPNDRNKYYSDLGDEGKWDDRIRGKYGSYPPPLSFVIRFGNGGGWPKLSVGYDSRFPQASPTSSEAVLGFTGSNSWRLISQDYFNRH